jgi:hypothetical protein
MLHDNFFSLRLLYLFHRHYHPASGPTCFIANLDLTASKIV